MSELKHCLLCTVWRILLATQLLIRVWRRRVSTLDSTRTMEVSFALTGKGYVLVASDQTAARSIVKMKADEDKIKVLGSHLIMAYSGEAGGYFLPH